MKLAIHKIKAAAQAFKTTFMKKNKFCAKSDNKRFALIVVLITILSAGAVRGAVIDNADNVQVNKTMSGMQSTTINTNNSFIVKVSGKGQAILLIPGLMSSAAVFDELVIDLSQNYEVHVLSVRGFAGVAPGSTFNLGSFGKEIAAYIQKAGLAKPHVIGHSMGGLTAFLLASEYSNSIGKVVSIDGLPFIGPIFTRSNKTTVDMLMPQAQNIKIMFASMNF